MEPVEFVMLQQHLAEKIFVQLNFPELITFSNVNSSCFHSVTRYLMSLKYMKIDFLKFSDPSREAVNKFLSSNTDLRHLNVVIDGSEHKLAMSDLCCFIKNNKNLQFLQLKTYYELNAELLQVVSSLSSLTKLHLIDHSLFQNQDPQSMMLGFYSDLRKRCRNLTEFSVKDYINDECLEKVSEMKLTHLDLVDCLLDDFELQKFVLGNPQIRKLDLTNTTVSGECLKLIPGKCRFLQHLCVTDPEDVDDVTVIADIMASCTRLRKLKFHCEEENLFLDFDVTEGKLKFNFPECNDQIERIFETFHPFLSGFKTVRLNGCNISDKILDSVKVRCRELRQINVINTSLVVRNAVIFDDVVLNHEYVIHLLKNNIKLEQIDLSFKEWSVELCNELCQTNSNIAMVKVRTMYEMGNDCKRMMDENFTNKSRNPLVYLGRRIK